MGDADYLNPPRPVPLNVKLGVIFGGFLNQFGWAFFGFGMVFFWIFGANSDFASVLHFRGELETVRGEVTRSKDTGFSTGGSEHRRGTPIYANHYVFRLESGEEYRGVSYATGRNMETGRAVSIEYPSGRPGISRIQGMRSAILPVWGLFVLIFPAVGLFLMIPGFLKGLKGARLLANGHLALGALKSKEPTMSRVNKRTVFKMTFEFTAHDGNPYTTSMRTHKPELLEDEEQELVLYDGARPQSAVMLDSLPGAPAIDQRGTVKAKKPGRSMAFLIVPALSILGHGGYFLLRYML